LLGVGCDKHGSLDVAEVLQALADLRHEIALTSAPSPPLRPAGTQNTRQAGYLRASEMVYPDGSSASPGRRSQGPRRPILGPAEREVLAQLRKGRKEGRRLGGAQLLAPFLEFDPFQDGEDYRHPLLSYTQSLFKPRGEGPVDTTISTRRSPLSPTSPY
jgi:hypothetical protein